MINNKYYYACMTRPNTHQTEIETQNYKTNLFKYFNSFINIIASKTLLISYLYVKNNLEILF